MTSPVVSFALPVYNGGKPVAKTIESILGQGLQDLELVISDNASVDDTPDILRYYADRDRRIVLRRNPSNIGIAGNFNRTFEMSRGTYFRWISTGDWVEPSYADDCIAALGAAPAAIGVTTYIAFWDEHGQKHYAEYVGPRVDSTHSHERFARALALMLADYRFFDPMYALYRREALAKTKLVRPIGFADIALSSELSLLGPLTHVPLCLAHRSRPLHPDPDWMKRLVPPGQTHLPYPPLDVFRAHLEMIREAELSARGTAVCLFAAANSFAQHSRRTSVPRLRFRLSKALRSVGVPIDAIKRKLSRGNGV